MKLSILFVIGVVIAVWTIISIIVFILCDDGKVSKHATRVSVAFLIVGLLGYAFILVLMAIYTLCAFGW